MEAHPQLRRCRPRPRQKGKTERQANRRRKASLSREKGGRRDGARPRRSDVRPHPSASGLAHGAAPPNPSSRRLQARARAPRAQGMFDLQDPLLPRRPRPKGAGAGAIPLPPGDRARRRKIASPPPWCLRCYALSRLRREREK